MPTYFKPVKELSDSENSAWLKVVQSEIQFESPFFHPCYSRLLGECGRPVEVAIKADDVSPQGFISYERHHERTARPLGIKLCDFQGGVLPTGEEWCVREFLNATGLDVVYFDHLQANQFAWCEYALDYADSPWLDLQTGYTRYTEDVRAQGSSVIQKTASKARKLVKQHGELEFCFDDPDPEVFRTILEWKSAQRKRTGTVDILQSEWVPPFLEKLRLVREDGLRGLVSSLRVGGALIAAHFGLWHRETLHYWFPVYNPEFSKFSPGSIFLFRLAEACEEYGITRIDLGKGDDEYKRSVATASVTVARGALDLRPGRRWLRSRSHQLKQSIRNSNRLRQAARWPKQVWQRLQMQELMG